MSDRICEQGSVAQNPKSLEELCELSGLTPDQVIECLTNQPDIFKLIRGQFEKKEQSDDTAYSNNNPPINKVVVMDTSICGIGGMITLLNLQKSVIVTNVVVRELKGLRQNNKHGQAPHATIILRNVANGTKPFVVVDIENSKDNVDDTVIDYCESRKEEVILFTADLEMAALARGKGINVCYFERKPIKLPVITNGVITPFVEEIGRKVTLDFAEYLGGRLTILLNAKSHEKRIVVYSGITEFLKGRFVLKVGHDIFVTRKKNNVITFYHYKVVSISKYFHCEIVYSARLENENGVNYLPEVRERNFMKKFYMESH